MAADPLDSFRLKLMQELLPVGLAVADRARKGGAKDVMAAFQAGDKDPLEQLRQEGEGAASQVRQSLDRWLARDHPAIAAWASSRSCCCCWFSC